MCKVLVTSILLLSAMFFNACKKNTQDPPVVCTTSFSATVSVIVQTNCAFSSGCHGTGSTNTGGPFTNFSLIAAKKDIIKGYNFQPFTDEVDILFRCGAAPFAFFLKAVKHKNGFRELHGADSAVDLRGLRQHSPETRSHQEFQDFDHAITSPTNGFHESA